jgi:hypothetical protein
MILLTVFEEKPCPDGITKCSLSSTCCPNKDKNEITYSCCPYARVSSSLILIILIKPKVYLRVYVVVQMVQYVAHSNIFVMKITLHVN